MVETSRLDVVLRFSLVLAALATSWAGHASAQPDAFVPRQVIVKFKSSATPADASALRSSVNATVHRRFATIGAELWDVAGIGVPGAVERLKADRRVVYAEPNYIVHAEDGGTGEGREWSPAEHA